MTRRATTIKMAVSALRREGVNGVLSRIHRIVTDRAHGDIVTSEYLKWLSFANAGMLAQGNISSMDYAIANLSSNTTILEIGSFCGLSTNTITFLKERHGKTTG